MAARKRAYYQKRKSPYRYSSKYSKKTRELQLATTYAANIIALVLVVLLAVFIYNNFFVKKIKLDIDVDNVAALNVSYSAFSGLIDLSQKYNISFYQALTYYCVDNQFFPNTPVVHDSNWLEENFIFNYEKIKNSYNKKHVEPFEDMFKTILTEIKYFPIPIEFDGEVGDDYMYGNSWGAQREYGGNRIHKGTDIVDRENIRGRIPVVSMTDGVIEHIGWNELGGFRIGVKSASGTYYYYAHLAEFASGLAVGSTVVAGEKLGLMGDTGYSKQEGTTGNFVVHLHVGICYNADFTNDEFWINPYVFLRNVEDNRVELQ